jgi:hypothetical protein
MHLKETECEDGDWIQMVQDKVQWQALMKKVMDLKVP